MDRVLTVAEVAKLLRVTPATVYHLAHGGKLTGFKVGTEWRFTSETLEEFMKSGMPIDDPK
jgi:excisionase family DNA binding protein